MPAIPPEVEARLKPALTAIAKLFRAPRITIIVRAPEVGNVKGDLVLGNDDLGKVAEALKALVVGEAVLFANSPDAMRIVEKEKTDGGLGPHFQDGADPNLYQPGLGRKT